MLEKMPWEGKVPERAQHQQGIDLGEQSREKTDDEIGSKLALGLPYADLVLKGVFGPTKPNIGREESRKLFQETGNSDHLLGWIEFDKQVIAHRVADRLASTLTEAEMEEAYQALKISGELTPQELQDLLPNEEEQTHVTRHGIGRRGFLTLFTGLMLGGALANTTFGTKAQTLVAEETTKQIKEIEEEGPSQKNLTTAWAITSTFFAIILSGIIKPDLLPIGKETATSMIGLALTRNGILRTGSDEDKELAAEELTELFTNFTIAGGLAELADLSNYVKIYVAKLIREYQPITETLDSIGQENIYTLLNKPTADNFSKHETRETALQDNLTKLMGQIAGTAFVSSAVATTYLGASIVKNNTMDVFRLKYHQILQTKINSLFNANTQITDEEYLTDLTNLQTKAQAEAMEFMNGINGFVNIFSKTAGNLVPFAAGDPPLFFHYLEFKDELAYLAETFGDGLVRGLILSLTNYIAFLSLNGMVEQIPGFIKGNLEAIKNLASQIKNAVTNSTFRDLALFEGDQTSKKILEIIKLNSDQSDEQIVALLNPQSTGIAVQITLTEKIKAQIAYVRSTWKKLQKASTLFDQTKTNLNSLAATAQSLENQAGQTFNHLIIFLQKATPESLSKVFDPKSTEVFNKIRDEILSLQKDGKFSTNLIQNLEQAQKFFGQSVMGKMVYEVLLKAERGQLVSESQDLASLTNLLSQMGLPASMAISKLQKKPLIELSIKSQIQAEATQTGVNLTGEQIQIELNKRMAIDQYQSLDIGDNTQEELAKAIHDAVEKIGEGLSGDDMGNVSQADESVLLEHTGAEVLDTLLTQIPAVNPLVIAVQNAILPQLFPAKLHENTEGAVAEMIAKIRTLFVIGAVLSGFADNVAAYLFMRKSIMEVMDEYLDLDDETREIIYKSVAKNTLFNAISAGTMSILGNGPTVETLEIGSSVISKDGDLVDIQTKNVSLSESIQSPITAATLSVHGAAASQLVVGALNDMVKFVRPSVLVTKTDI